MNMKINTGGYVSPANVIGRDEFIDNLWATLEQQSVVLTSERRIGKSSVINKMEKGEHPGYLVVKRDVEGVSTAKEFVLRLVDDLSNHQSRLYQGQRWLKSAHKQLEGAKLFGFAMPMFKEKPWHEILESILTQLSQIMSEQNKKLLLIWDEFPWMLQKIKMQESPEVAANLLDNLRQSRQGYTNIRMIFTGSIGLHHVIKELKSLHLANEPLNDMLTINLPPLEDKHACSLAEGLIKGAKLGEPVDAFLQALTTEVDNVPYYIHHFVDSMKKNKLGCDISSIQKIIQAAFSDANDTWHLKHYRERLEEYYLQDADWYEFILNELAEQEAGLTPKQLQQYLLSNPDIVNNPEFLAKSQSSKQLRAALELLAADHYITLNPTNQHYHFAFSLIRRWWQLRRG